MGSRLSNRFSRKPDPQIEQKVQDLIDQNPVMIFSKSYCPFCTKTKDMLKRGRVPFKAVELDRDSKTGTAMQTYLEQKTGQRTVPNCFVGKQHIGGNDAMQAAANNGSLKQMLDRLGVKNKL